MTFSLKALASALIATTLASAAVAQTRYCMGGDLDHMSAAERASCSAAKEGVKATATQLHAPADWHFVIVCGEQGWKDYTAVADSGAVALQDAAADTDLSQHVTYIREGGFMTPQSRDLRLVVTHEMASIHLNTHDEGRIQAQLTVWDNAVNARNDARSTKTTADSGI